MAYMNLMSEIINSLTGITGRKYSFPKNGLLCDSEKVVNISDITDAIMTSAISFEAGLIKIMARFDEAYNPGSYVAA